MSIRQQGCSEVQINDGNDFSEDEITAVGDYMAAQREKAGKWFMREWHVLPDFDDKGEPTGGRHIEITTQGPLMNDNQPGPLTRAAMSSLRVFFDAQGHYPSDAHWTALGDIARTIEAMLDGSSEHRLFLSAVDPGCGKTQTVIHMARALLRSPDHDGKSMIVCVGRIAEAEAMAAGMNDFLADVAVLVQEKHPANKIGRSDPTEARVLITTQQRVERATDKRPFGAVSSLYYRGKPREARVWDESFLPGVPISLNVNDLGFLFKPLQRLSPDFHAGILAFFTSLNASATGDLVDVPDFEALYGFNVHDLLAVIPDGAEGVRDDQRATAKSLFILAGRTARVWRDKRDGSAVLSYEDTIPDDLKPLLILDASGRVRTTYEDLEKHRGLVRLRSAAKDYSPLKVHVWRRGGGKTSFKGDAGNPLIGGIARTIATHPNDNWLVVIHKPGNGVPNIERRLRRALGNDVAQRVHVISWGQHMARNDYADFPRVILAGTLFTRESHYVALTHLAQDKPVAPGLVAADEIRRTAVGEHSNFVLQALCRGRVRRLQGDQCFPMDAYVIAATVSGIPDALPTIFPGCQVLPWKPVTGHLSDAAGKALLIVKGAQATGIEWLPYSTISKALAMDHKNLMHRVVNSNEWIHAVRSLGVLEEKNDRGHRGLRLAA